MTKKSAALSLIGFLALAGALYLLTDVAGQVMPILDLLKAWR